jgi:ribosomal protein S18 acetylase RimI-like enzyme
MLRPAAPTDTPAILALAVDTAMFPAHELGPVRDMLDGFHAGQLAPGHRVEVCVDDPAGAPVGVAYFGPDPAADRKWDLWMLAVAPARQGQGIGGRLLRSAEAHARAGDGRLMLIETSSLPRFTATHAFYRKHGYAEVARIPDYYRDGDSKVVFARRLSG